jgi:hypothetical protein
VRRIPGVLPLLLQRRHRVPHNRRAGLDEGLLSFCLPILILYGDSLLEEHISVTNDSAPSYVQVRSAARSTRAISRSAALCARPHPPCCARID